MKIDDDMFRPLKKMEPVMNSGSLKFNSNRAAAEREAQIALNEMDLDLILKNIRKILIDNPKMTFGGISLELIDKISRFENLNDFTLTNDIEKFIAE